MLKFGGKTLNRASGMRGFWLLICLLAIPVTLAIPIAFNTLTKELIEHEREHLKQAAERQLVSAHLELQARRAELTNLLSFQKYLTRSELTEVLDQSLNNYLVVAPTYTLSKGISQDEARGLVQYSEGETGIVLSSSVEHDRTWVGGWYTEGIFAATAVDPFALWEARDHLPDHSAWCVIDGSGARIHCPHHFDEQSIRSTIKKSRSNPNGDLEWYKENGDYIGSYKTLFLRSGLESPRWIILTRVSADSVLSPIGKLGRHFAVPIALFIVIALMILVFQLRKNMGPLESLLEGTRRIGKKDFSTRIHLEGEDEFAELAKSFNLMSSQLDRQFLSIEVSAQIDETILSTFDMRKVVNLVLEKVFEIFDCSFSSIVLIDQEGESGRIHYCVKGSKPKSMEVLSGLDLSNLQRLEWFNPQSSVPEVLENIFKCARQRFSGVSVPICAEQGLVGLFVLNADKETQDLEVTEEVLNDFAQRLAVARSADEWEGRLKHQALHDALTGLPNRLSFQKYLKNQINSVQSLAVLFVDLDHFKNVNDTKGHSTGDQLLQLAAKRLQQSASPYGRVFRLGGDEFTVVTDEMDKGKVANIVEHILELMRSPFRIDSREFFVTASVGVSFYPENGHTMETLLKNADLAMYFAKQNGRNSYKLFDSSMMSSTYCRSVLEADLRKAVKERQFFLVYQPQVNVKTQEVHCLEALIRWQHPEHGKILPDVFIPLAEEIGLIEAIDKWVVDAVFEQFALWVNQDVSVNRIALNVSPATLRSADYLAHIRRLMVKHPTPDFLENTEQTLNTLNQIKALSINIALDDFGTGYSSLSYLHKFPIDSLKIDMSFIKDVSQAKGTKSIVQAIIKVAKSLNLSVVAEGVESEEQLMFLYREGCELAQGFYYSEPLQVDLVPDYVDGFKVEALRLLSG